VGIEGSESSLARVSVVNFHGAVLLDEFVSQKERIVDYRTQWSGIRPADMVHARPFEEVQQKVANILKDRILIGHAIFNDLRALLLDHPRQYLRDTQHLAYKHKVVKGKRPALRNLVKQELDLVIQEGEHSSVTDARATMAIFRLHKKEWERNVKTLPSTGDTESLIAHASGHMTGVIKLGKHKKKRLVSELDEAEQDMPQKGPARANQRKSVVSPDHGNRKGVSSGLSVVIKRSGKDAGRNKHPAPSQAGWSKLVGKQDWWKQL
jgi:RNA exonuclease 4